MEDDLEDLSLRRNEELKKALRRYGRKKLLREIIFWLVVAGAGAVPIGYDFTRTEILVWFGFMLVGVMFEQLRKHVRAMQVRLATMQDQLDHLAGEDVPIGNVLSELSHA
jgi:hypothetical protein